MVRPRVDVSMEGQMAKARIAGFFVNGQIVSKSQVGDILEMLYLGEASEIDIQPCYHDPDPLVHFSHPESRHIAATLPRHRALPAAPSTPSPSKKTRVSGVDGGAKGIILAALAKGPATVEAVRERVLSAGYQLPSFHSRLFEMKKA